MDIKTDLVELCYDHYHAMMAGLVAPSGLTLIAGLLRQSAGTDEIPPDAAIESILGHFVNGVVPNEALRKMTLAQAIRMRPGAWEQVYPYRGVLFRCGAATSAQIADAKLQLEAGAVPEWASA